MFDGDIEGISRNVVYKGKVSLAELTEDGFQVIESEDFKEQDGMWSEWKQYDFVEDCLNDLKAKLLK